MKMMYQSNVRNESGNRGNPTPDQTSNNYNSANNAGGNLNSYIDGLKKVTN